jgi:hypothetical protein
MKKLVYLILIMIIVGLAYLKWQAAKLGEPGASPSPSPSPAQAVPMMSFKKLETPYFTLEYSPDATSSSSSNPDATTWAISYMGAAQRASGRTQTELWDGYSYSVTRFEVTEASGSARVQAQADHQGIVDGCGAERATTIKPAELGPYATISFSGGCLGEAVNHYFTVGDALYRISLSNLGDQNTETVYQQALDQITASLHFTDSK